MGLGWYYDGFGVLIQVLIRMGYERIWGVLMQVWGGVGQGFVS